MKGNSPSVLTFGFVIAVTSSIELIILSAWGRLFSDHTSFAPKAEGSVHIPYSDQKPGRKMVSEKVSIALKLAFSHISSLV